MNDEEIEKRFEELNRESDEQRQKGQTWKAIICGIILFFILIAVGLLIIYG